MKKITQLFLTILFTGMLSFANAQFSVQGIFQNGGVGVANLDVTVAWSGGLDSLVTDTNGYFFGGSFTTQATQGVVTLAYVDCNGNYITQQGSFSPANSVIDFGTIDWCPSTTSYTASVTGVFTNINAPVSINYSWDNGITYNVATSNSGGVFYQTTVTSSAGVLYLNYVDCNGNTVTLNDSYSSSNPNIDFGNIDWCPTPPPVCDANFYLDQNVVFNQATNTYTTGPVMVIDSSIGTNLTYTWDFGDGSAPYTGVNFVHIYANAGPYNLCLTIDNGNGCMDTFCDSLMIDSNGVLTGKTNGGFTIQMGNGSDDTNGPNAIIDLEDEISLEIYPNPASTTINVSLKSNVAEQVTISLYNVVGKLVQQNNVNLSLGKQVVKMKVNDLNSGLYILQLSSSKGTFSKKITIK